MQNQIHRRKIIEAYAPDDGENGVLILAPFGSQEPSIKKGADIKLDEPENTPYNIGVMFYNDDSLTVEISAFDKSSGCEVKRLVCRNMKELNGVINRAVCLLLEE